MLLVMRTISSPFCLDRHSPVGNSLRPNTSFVGWQPGTPCQFTDATAIWWPRHREGFRPAHPLLAGYISPSYRRCSGGRLSCMGPALDYQRWFLLKIEFRLVPASSIWSLLTMPVSVLTTSLASRPFPVDTHFCPKNFYLNNHHALALTLLFLWSLVLPLPVSSLYYVWQCQYFCHLCHCYH